MELKPKGPPGRPNRKALQFNAEIHRLRAEGYSIEAIRMALRDVGIEVGSTTVRREIARCSRQANMPARRQVDAGPIRDQVPPSNPIVPTVHLTDQRSGKEIAELFMKTRISNPLIRARSHSEDRHH
jgi:hypothetical protein